jgi:hypothetical protein
MNEITIKSADDNRTDAEAQRAAPVSLPAGSYDVADLEALNDTSKAKFDKPKDGEKTRDEVREQIVNNANQTPLPTDTLGVPPGYSRVDVADETLGVTESRVVFDEKKIEEAERAQENYREPIDPAAERAGDTAKGE